jgi:succinate dehydrogenase hydrophobic anchor subunit
MVSFHSYVSLPEGMAVFIHGNLDLMETMESWINQWQLSIDLINLLTISYHLVI